jgi:hypothetical protein
VVGLTFGTLFHTTGFIQAAENIKPGVLVAMGAIGWLCPIRWIIRFFGWSIPFLSKLRSRN